MLLPGAFRLFQRGWSDRHNRQPLGLFDHAESVEAGSSPANGVTIGSRAKRICQPHQ